MKNMHLYHPSIVKLYNRKCTKINYNLLISVFGMNKGIRLISRTANHLFNQGLIPNALMQSPSSNLILSNEIREKFELKNEKFALLTKSVLSRVAEFHSSQFKNNSNKDNAINNNKCIKIKINNWTKNKSSCCQRYYKVNQYQIYQYDVAVVINIQRQIRGYLGRRNILAVVNNLLKEKTTKSIVFIQAFYRRYYQHKKMKIATLVKKIVSYRKEKCFNIISNLSLFKSIIEQKKRVIISDIIDYRNRQIIKIQNYYRSYRLIKLVKVIIDYEKNHYVLEYPFYAKSLQMKLYFNKNMNKKSNEPYQFIFSNIIPKYKLFSFEFCPLRKIFVLYIKKEELINGKYRCQLIVDGLVTCDGRFPHVECEDGQFYNLIELAKGKVIASGNTKKTNGSDNESRDSYTNKAKKSITSDEEDRKTYETLRKDLSGRPPVCIYDKLNGINLRMQYDGNLEIYSNGINN